MFDRFRRQRPAEPEFPIKDYSLADFEHPPEADTHDAPELYIADLETIAALRLETSMLEPRREKIIHDETVKIKEMIMQNYQSSIQPETLDKVADVEDRVIVMDKEHFAMFFGEWDQSHDDVDNAHGVTHRYGDIIALNDPDAGWDITSDTDHQNFIQRFGDEKAARKVHAAIFVMDNLAHEVIHMFQDDSLPRSFLEIATRYYQRQTTLQLKYGNMNNQRMDDSIDVYEQVIARYGDGVNDVYFGKPMDTSLRDEIVSSTMNLANNYPDLIEPEDTQEVANKYTS